MADYQTALFIFRRDLRIEDNTALNAALTRADTVIAAFIFDSRQVQAHAYHSKPAFQFMLESLLDLQQQLTAKGGLLHVFYGEPEQVVGELKQSNKIDAVFVNRDYTPFSQQRDNGLRNLCQNLHIDFNSYADILLNEPEQVLNNSGQPYQVFTAYFQRAKQLPVAVPINVGVSRFLTTELKNSDANLITKFKAANNNPIFGGRSHAMTILANIKQKSEYSNVRDFPVLAGTTGLSAYLKFGCCSMREAYWAVKNVLGQEHALIRQFYWRDFFTQIAYHYPQVFGQAFQKRFQSIVWQNDKERFWLWANGETGFPIIDAAMRELNQTGWMHNRLRMITASFLVKDLHISWRWGERYFAQHLLYYDPCLNNGNWQWAASTGCDAQPYFRIFNPWLQQKKFDPDCLYIKRWLPELAGFSTQAIHQSVTKPLLSTYPRPMVDHQLQSQISKEMFYNASL